MKFILVILMLPMISSADFIPLDDGGKSSPPVYNDYGWDISKNPQAMTPGSRCQGDMCPQVVFQRLRITSMKTYDFVASKPQMSAYEIVARLGFSESANDRSFQAARLIVEEIKDSQSRQRSKDDFINQQSSYVNSTGDRNLRLLKAQIMAQIADRISP